MPLVFHRTKLERTTFRKLAKGADYWLASQTNVVPNIKYQRTSYLGGLTNLLPGTLTPGQVADVSVPVVKIPQIWLGQNNSNR